MKRYTHLEDISIEIILGDEPLESMDPGEFGMCVFNFFDQMVKYYEENPEMYKKFLPKKESSKAK